MRFPAKKVLVIGGAGYVGSVLVEELLKRGYAVKVFDRLIYGDHGLQAVRDRVELTVGDMRAIEPAVFEDAAAVVNLGGLSNDPTAEFNPTANYEMNTIATERAAKLAKDAGVKRFLFASTCSIYDQGVEDPEADLILDEAAAVNPRAAYSSSKFEAEQRLLPLADEHFCPVVLRKGTLYGYSPRMRFDLVVNTFLKDALSRGSRVLYQSLQDKVLANPDTRNRIACQVRRLEGKVDDRTVLAFRQVVDDVQHIQRTDVAVTVDIGLHRRCGWRPVVALAGRRRRIDVVDHHQSIDRRDIAIHICVCRRRVVVKYVDVDRQQSAIFELFRHQPASMLALTTVS